MSRVVLAMSGGVDSSVAASLLLEEGHEVIGLFMRHGHQEATACSTEGGGRGHKHGCCTAADAADGRRVAERLGIPFYAINFEDEFNRIIHYFVSEYSIGRTPNPCVVCNTWLKFGKLMEYADSVGAQYIATGHYARRMQGPGGEARLCRGLDPSKDQSYVLWGIRPEVLSRILFPVGGFHKDEIRAIAERLGMRHVAEKPDSQEICFVPDQDHARFVRENRESQETAGEVVTTQGVVVGQHDGYERFTVGQRKGLGIAFGEPRYVVRLEPETRRVVVGTKDDLARSSLRAAGANWLAAVDSPLRCDVKIRYRSEAVPATVTLQPGNRFEAEFHAPCHGVAPGQAVVCYVGDQVMGGGWIE